jgi:hypothetical protein
MTVLITLTSVGSDAGPFNLYSDADGFISAFEVGVAKIDLLAGYSSSLVPDPTTIIRVMSINPLCTNYIDLELYPTTTTTTTYLPLAFSTSYSCIPEPDISISAFSITGGSELYFAGTTYFLDEPSALANTSWLPSVSTVTYNVGTTNGSFWIVIIDSVGNILAQEVITSCTTTTTTTTAPIDFVLTSSCDGSGNGTIQTITYTGGVGPYQAGNGFFLSEAAALSNTSWISTISFSIGIGPAIGATYWMVIRDSLGTLKAKDIVVDCSNAYLLSRCNDGDPYVVAQTYPFVVGEVIQFQVGVPGAGTVYCGTIDDANYIGTPDAEIYSATAYSCGDGINCI